MAELNSLHNRQCFFKYHGSLLENVLRIVRGHGSCMFQQGFVMLSPWYGSPFGVLFPALIKYLDETRDTEAS